MSMMKTVVIICLCFVITLLFVQWNIHPLPFIHEDCRKSVFRSEPTGGLLYDYYSSLERPETTDYALYVVDPFDDEYLLDLANSMIGDKTDKTKIINAIGKYAQDIPYKAEECEYPKYPVETIEENEGDCEDKAILASALLDVLDIPSALIRIENHMLISVNVDGVWEYLETTTKGKKLGDSADTVPAETIPVEDRPILFHTWNATLYSISIGPLYAKGTVTVFNMGIEEARNVELVVISNSTQRKFFNLEPFQYAEFSFSVDSSGSLTTELYYNNEMIDRRVNETRKDI